MQLVVGKVVVIVLCLKDVEYYGQGKFRRLYTADRRPELMLLVWVGNVGDWFHWCCAVMHCVSSEYILRRVTGGSSSMCSCTINPPYSTSIHCISSKAPNQILHLPLDQINKQG